MNETIEVRIIVFWTSELTNKFGLRRLIIWVLKTLMVPTKISIKINNFIIV